MRFDDYQQITARLDEYALGIDTRDWALYRAIFTDEVAIDFSSYDGNPARVMTADEWVAGVRPLFTALDATQHSMSNPLVEVDGERATCRMYMQAEHFLENDRGAPDFAIGGYYDDRLRRTDRGWLIDAVTLTVLWRRGNADIMQLALETSHSQGR